MSDFNENNNQESFSENQNAEPIEAATVAVENGNENISEISNMNGPEIVGGVETAKKNTTKIIAIIVAVVILIFGCCAGAYAFIPQVKNSVKMLMNSPEEYYAWVESQDTEESMKSFTEFLFSNKEIDPDELNRNLAITFEPDQQGIEKLISENAGMSLSEAGITLPKKIDITSKAAFIDGYNAANSEMLADGESILTSNVYMKDGKTYIQYPELSSSYVCLDIVEAFKQGIEEGIAESDDNEFSAAMSKALEKMEAPSGEEKEPLLSQSEFEDIIGRYSDIIINNIKNVKMEKNSECDADGVKCEYTKLIVNLDQGTLFSIVKDMINEFPKEEKIIDLVAEYTELSKEDILAALDEASKNFGGLEMDGGEVYAIMNVYVNNKGEIVGRSFENAGDNGDYSVGYICTKDGDNYGVSLFAKINEEKYSADGSASENAGKFTGQMTVSGNGQKDIFGISFKDFECGEEYLKGEATLGLSSFGLDDVTLKFDEKDGEQTCAFDFTYGGSKIGSFNIKSNNEAPDKITVFNNDAKVYENENASDYDKEVDYGVLLKKIYKGLFGLDEKALAEMGIDVDNFSNIIYDIDSNISDDYDIDPDLYLDDDQTDDFDTDDLDTDYEESSVKYDMSKIKFQLNGKDVKLPGKIDGALDNVEFDSEKIDAHEYSYAYSNDNNMSFNIYNPTGKEMNSKDCEIYGISVNDYTTGYKFTVDGIGIGDDVQKIVDKYGCRLEKEDSEYGFTSVEDTNGYNYLSFMYNDGKIISIDIMFSASSAADNMI